MAGRWTATFLRRDAAIEMANVNPSKRAAHRRRVQAALQAILNDPAVMPNADCADLVVSVSRVEFGRTVAQVFVQAHARRRRPPEPGAESPHARYMRDARLRGEPAYADFDEVLDFPHLTAAIERELQRRLGLLYSPTVRRLSDVGGRPERERDGRRIAGH